MNDREPPHTRAGGLARAVIGALVVAAVAPLACVSEPAGPPPVFDIAEACAEYVAAHETAARCGRLSNTPEVIAEWRPVFDEQCRRWLRAPGSGITTSVLHACSVNIRRMCISYGGIGAVGLDPYYDFDLCDLDLPGTLPDDAPCRYSAQCAGGKCLRYEDDCGRCVTPSPVGELCVPYGCAKGSECPGCKGTNCSVGFRCRAVAEAGEGESCEGARCSRWLVCDPATRTCTLPGPPGAACQDSARDYCRFMRCEKGACVDQSPEGGACPRSGDWGCQQGLVCDFYSIADHPHCVARAEWVPVGAACDTRRWCERGWCFDGKCVLPPRLGEPCDLDVQPRKPDLRCPPLTQCIDGTCQLFDPGACR